MIRRIKIILVLMIIASGAWWVVSFALSFKDVSFDLPSGEYSVQVRNSKGKPVTQISTSQSVKLRTGEYFYNITTKGYDNKIISFNVNGDTKVTIRPEYTSDQLLTFAEDSKQPIITALASKYPETQPMTIKKISVDKTATWAYGTLTVEGDDSLYRFIAKKSDRGWNIPVDPAVAIYKGTAKDIPEEIVYALYE